MSNVNETAAIESNEMETEMTTKRPTKKAAAKRDDNAVSDMEKQAEREAQQAAKAAEKEAERARKAAEREAAKRAKAAEREAEKARKAVDQEAHMYDGFALSDGADPETIKGYVETASAALSEITQKDSQLVGHYLALGEFQSKAAPMFKSTKIYGQFLKEKLPASQALDPALRSNCKWLFENLGDVCRGLGVNRIEDYKSGNPTVIRREYSAILKAAEIKAKAEAEGISEEELAENEKAAKKAAQEAEKSVITEGVAAIRAHLKAAKRIEACADEGASILETILKLETKKDVVEFIRDHFLKSEPAGEHPDGH